MNRRRFLAVVAAGAGATAGCRRRGRRDGSTAGCSSPDRRDGSTATRKATSTAARKPVATPESLARMGFPATICEQSIVDVGIDVKARAYPLALLREHEIVNDDFGGPVIVTYCPLCFSGMVAERVVDGEETSFGVSGQLWQPPELRTRIAEEDDRVFGVNSSDPDAFVAVRNTGNLVMYDTLTGSFWSQMLARAICGERRGTLLTAVPSTTTRWGDWRAAHSTTEILLPPPESTAGNPPIDGDGPDYSPSAPSRSKLTSKYSTSLKPA